MLPTCQRTLSAGKSVDLQNCRELPAPSPPIASGNSNYLFILSPSPKEIVVLSQVRIRSCTLKRKHDAHYGPMVPVHEGESIQRPSLTVATQRSFRRSLWVILIVSISVEELGDFYKQKCYLS